MAAADSGERESWWPAVLAVAGIVVFLGVMELLSPGFVWEPRRTYEPPSLDRPASDVTCREIEDGVDTQDSLVVAVTDELKLPARVDCEVAEFRAYEAIWDACSAADPNEHPVDSDFMGSLRAKLVEGRAR